MKRVVIIAMFLCVCCYIAYKISDNIVYDTEEKITMAFEENKELFGDIANKFLKFDCDWDIRKKKPDTRLRPDWKVTTVKRGVNLVICDSDYFDEFSLSQCAEQNVGNLEAVLKKIQFKIISHDTNVDPGCIYFIADTSIGYSSGIIYSPNGNPTNPYLIKLKKLEDSWYYYEQK